MTPLGRRALARTLAALTLASALSLPQPARADLWGGDLPLLTGILVEAFIEVFNLASMLTQIVTEVNLMRTMLSRLESGSFDSLLGFLTSTRMTASTLTSGVNAMTFTLQRIDREFKALFPGTHQSTRFEQHAQYYRQWNEEVLAASQIASRQQTVVTMLEDSASKAHDLVQQSQGTEGEVAQLQLIVQMLGIIHTQLLTLNQTLATTSRVLTDMAASGASDRQLSATKKEDSLDHYTDHGDPVTVPARLP